MTAKSPALRQLSTCLSLSCPVPAMDPPSQNPEAENLSFPSNRESRELSVIAAHHSMRDYAAREWPRLNHKGRLAKLCRLFPTWTDRRVRAVYNAEQGVSLRADEHADIERLTAIEEANRDDFQALQARVARLEAALIQADAEFHQPTLAALREITDAGRGGDVPRDPSD